MTKLFGSLRTVVRERYALLTPESFVPSTLPGWSDAVCVVQISPAMGARFSQTLVTMTPASIGGGQTGTSELFAYLLEGQCTVSFGQKKSSLATDSYVYVPPQRDYLFGGATAGTRLLLFEKTYAALEAAAGPQLLIAKASDISGQPFLGDADARLQVLLPEQPAFDMAVNIFAYLPGATLPFVESHVMEHGLMMLAGQGIYRLDNDWHPVQAGDVIWMAPYCPQWFAAMGKTPASYIYYKDVNRSALASQPSKT